MQRPHTSKTILHQARTTNSRWMRQQPCQTPNQMRREFQAGSLGVGKEGKKALISVAKQKSWGGKTAAATKKPAAEKKPTEEKPTTEGKMPVA